MKNQVTVILALFLASCGANDPVKHNQDLDGRLISDLIIVGQKPMDPTVRTRIRSYISSRKGTVYSQNRIDQDLKDAYHSGLVDDIQFFVEPQNRSVQVTAEVTPRPMFR